MAQKIMKDTGLLLEDGRTEAEYTADPQWNDLYFDVVDTGQTFEERTIYFYFPTLNQFFKSTKRIHAVYRAAKTLFTESRWDEIEDILDEHGIREHLHTFDLSKARRKIQRARSKGMLTATEVQSLADLVAHLNGS